MASKCAILIVYGNHEKLLAGFMQLLKSRVTQTAASAFSVYCHEGIPEYVEDVWPEGLHMIAVSEDKRYTPYWNIETGLMTTHGEYAIYRIGLLVKQDYFRLRDSGYRTGHGVAVNESEIERLAGRMEEIKQKYRHDASAMRDTGMRWIECDESVLYDNVRYFDRSEPGFKEKVDMLAAQMADVMTKPSPGSDLEGYIEKYLRPALEEEDDGLRRVYVCDPDYADAIPKEDMQLIARLMRKRDKKDAPGRDLKLRPEDIGRIMETGMFGRPSLDVMACRKDFAQEAFSALLSDRSVPKIVMDRDPRKITFANGTLSYDGRKGRIAFSKRTAGNAAPCRIEYEDSAKLAEKLTDAEKETARDISSMLGEDRDAFRALLGTCMKPGSDAGTLFCIAGDGSGMDALRQVIDMVCFYSRIYAGRGPQEIYGAVDPYATVVYDDFNGADWLGLACLPGITNHAFLRFYGDKLDIEPASLRHPPKSYVVEIKAGPKGWSGKTVKSKAGSRERIARYLAAEESRCLDKFFARLK